MDWKEVVVAESRYKPGICLEEMSKVKRGKAIPVTGRGGP
jgi:hypothetical protein